jgi:peptidoglycan/xylan/chitin deacetylase (PgdA/CDA1 family)
MTKLSDQEIADQLERTSRALQNVAKSSPSLFRPPYGAANEKLMAALEARQMKAVLWDIDSEDWADPIPKSIANRVLSSVDSEGRGIALDPNRAIAYVNLGDAYVALDRKEDARRSYETCIKLAPNTVFSQSASSKLAELNK